MLKDCRAHKLIYYIKISLFVDRGIKFKNILVDTLFLKEHNFFMDSKQFSQIESWFVLLIQKIEGVEQRLDLKIENRFQALMTVCSNIRKEVEILKADLSEVKKDLHAFKEIQGKFDEYDARIKVLELALKELERRLSH